VSDTSGRWKLLCFVLMASSVALGFATITAMLRARSADKALDGYIAVDATAKHFGRGRFTAPEIPDAPAGSKPLFTAEGTVTFHATPGASRTEPTPTSPPGEHKTELAAARPDPTAPPVPAEKAGCSLDDVDLKIRCRLDGIASPGAPWGRLNVSGTLWGFGQVRDLPATPAGDVELKVAPWLNPSTWHLDLLAGASSAPGFELGATWTGRSRWGPYVLVEYDLGSSSTGWSSYSEQTITTTQPATWRIHAGARFRVR